MKRGILIASLVSTVFLSACGGKDAVKPVADCVFPDSPAAAAPGWVCDQPVEGVAVSAVGVAEKTAAGVNFQKDMASASARTELARNMKVHVQNMVKQYVEATGTGSSEAVDKVNSSVTKQITEQTLVGSRIYRSIVNPNTGAMYVLLGMDEATTQKATENAVKSSMANDAALWQQFKAAKSQEEMAAEIAKGKQ